MHMPNFPHRTLRAPRPPLSGECPLSGMSCVSARFFLTQRPRLSKSHASLRGVHRALHEFLKFLVHVAEVGWVGVVMGARWTRCVAAALLVLARLPWHEHCSRPVAPGRGGTTGAAPAFALRLVLEQQQKTGVHGMRFGKHPLRAVLGGLRALLHGAGKLAAKGAHRLEPDRRLRHRWSWLPTDEHESEHGIADARPCCTSVRHTLCTEPLHARARAQASQ